MIRFFTIPNVVANEKEDCKSIDELVLQVENSYTFLFGDWKQINDVLHNQGVKFDWIVTAETLYCEENYSKLYKIFSSCLRKPGGEVLIATKSHYFGVGGGAISFLDYLDTRRHKRAKSDQAEVSTLEAEIVKDIESTLLRHIIQLRWPSWKFISMFFLFNKICLESFVRLVYTIREAVWCVMVVVVGDVKHTKQSRLNSVLV